MSVRKKFRAIMTGKKLVLMPGCYDALSARVIEAEGFEAVVAGGYAAVGSLLAQPDMGQSNMRDYADHYGRVCAAVNVPVYVDADTGFGGVNNVRQMVRAFEDAGVVRPVHQRPGVPEPLRLPARQAGISDRADAGQDEGRARRAPRSRPVHRRAHRRRRRDLGRGRDRALPAVHGGRRRHGEADGRRHHPGHQARDARNSRARTWRRCRRRPGRRRAASKTSKRPAWSRRRSRRCRCSRRPRRCATRSARCKRQEFA